MPQRAASPTPTHRPDESKRGDDPQPLPRVLFVCGGHRVYGAERKCLAWIQGLHERGFPIFCTVNGWNDGEFPRNVQAIGVPFEEIKLGWLYRSKPRWTLDTLRHLPTAFRAYVRVVRRFQPDVAIHIGYRSVIQLSWLLGSRNIVAVPDYWVTSWERRVLPMFDRRVAAYVPPSDDVGRHLASLGLPAEKIHRIYNPVHFGERRSAPTRSGGGITFGLVGQIVPRKGHHVAIRALAQLCEARSTRNVILRVYGNGDAETIAELQQLAADLGVSDLIEWCGYCSNRDEMYGGLDCVLVPSTEPEPFGWVAVEPSCYGIPVITSDAGGLREIVQDGETGFQVSAGDVESLAERMSAICESRQLAARLATQAFEWNAARFGDESILNEFAALVRRVAEC